MAEIVRRVDPMIEEIEEMKRLKLFSVTEANLVLKKRKQLECKINGVVKNIQDYKDYIRYEKLILNDIKLRRNKFGIVERKGNLEMKILTRIKYLYEVALPRFEDDFNFSLSYFNFCKDSNFPQAASLVVKKMMKQFPQYPEVWEAAAAWYMTRDIKESLTIIHKGLTIHSHCEALYYQAVQLEFIAKEVDEGQDNEHTHFKDDIFCKKIEMYINAVVQNIDNYKCLLDIINLLDQHNFVKGIQHKGIEKLMVRYCNEAAMWQALAEREKNGHHYPIPEDLRTTTKFRLTRCLEKFELGLSKICSEKKNALWLLYLDFLIGLYQQKDVSNNMIKTTLIQKLKEASTLSILTERHYLIWSKMLTNNEEVLKVIEEGLKVLPKSVELWKQKLSCLVVRDNPTALNIEFKKGHLVLKADAGPLWALLIKYHLLTSTNKVIEAIYRDACTQIEPIGNQHKPNYIEWVALNKDIKEARRMYQELAINPPFCKELHAKMAQLEMTEINVNVRELERCLKLACEQFGSKDVDVWIHLQNCYLDYHQHFKKIYPTFNVNNTIVQIGREAQQALKDNALLLADFIDKFDSNMNIENT